jgi:hypothetical protein
MVAQPLRTVTLAPTIAWERGAARGPDAHAPDLDLLARRAATLRALLAKHPGVRVLAPREATAGMQVRERFPMAIGHEPAVAPRWLTHLLEEARLGELSGLRAPSPTLPALARPGLLARLGVGLLVVPAAEWPRLATSGWSLVGTLPPGDAVLYRAPVPRARLVHRAVVARGDAETLAGLIAHETTPEVAVVDAPYPALAAPAPDAVESAAIVRDDPERVDVAVTVAAPALLVLGDAWGDGWEATVDGRAVPVLRADHAFRAVAVTPDARGVVFRYAPPTLRVGAACSLAAVLVVAVLVAPRRGRPTSPPGRG